MLDEKIAIIKQAFDEKCKKSMKAIKPRLGEEFSYNEIPLVLESVPSQYTIKAILTKY